MKVKIIDSTKVICCEGDYNYEEILETQKTNVEITYLKKLLVEVQDKNEILKENNFMLLQRIKETEQKTSNRNALPTNGPKNQISTKQTQEKLPNYEASDTIQIVNNTQVPPCSAQTSLTMPTSLSMPTSLAMPTSFSRPTSTEKTATYANKTRNSATNQIYNTRRVTNDYSTYSNKSTETVNNPNENMEERKNKQYVKTEENQGEQLAEHNRNVNEDEGYKTVNKKKPRRNAERQKKLIGNGERMRNSSATSPRPGYTSIE
ncbi:hypothetical protein JTB14_022018 [Gonioctena quinquepunctata]|nr:hypothetical protein JTB14_022018 [Gonioctena quinquepunctata]